MLFIVLRQVPGYSFILEAYEDELEAKTRCEGLKYAELYRRNIIIAEVL